METTVSVATDHHRWALDTAQAIRERRFDAVDWERVAEELHSLGRAEENQLESRLTRLMYYLLKMEHQPERRTRSWERSIREQRRRLMMLLRKEPSLKQLLCDGETLGAAYGDVFAEATRENLPDQVIDLFPETCPFTPEQLLPELRDA